MTDDRKLLEDAAKAAGIDYIDLPDAARGLFMRVSSAEQMHWWSPLTDDGDALRLAVKLRLPITFADWSDGETVVVAFGGNVEADNIVTADPYASTRRAVVRAAAAIGEKLCI
jgi:hypothetical protein